MNPQEETTRACATMVLLTVILSSAAVACAKRSHEMVRSGPAVSWPPPPAAARIEYVLSFAKPEDLNIRKAWFKRLFSYLGRGRRPVEMLRPYAITVDPAGRIAVADPDARCVHLYDPARSRYDRLREANGVAFVSPIGIAADALGTLYISDSARRRVFRRDKDGRWLEPLGSDDGLLRPTGLAYDPARGVLYVVDTLAHGVAAYDAAGHLLRVFGGRGTEPGRFNYPVAVAVGPGGRVYVTDSMNFRVAVFDPRGDFYAAFGRPGSSPGGIDKAKGIAVDRDGHVFVVEALHDVVQVFDSTGKLLTVIGGTGTGPGEFWLPTGIHIDAKDRIFIADSSNRRIQILQYLGDPPASEGP